MRKNGVKKFIGTGIKVLLGSVVIAFLGMKSLDFFYFTTPADQWFYAYLGFGLTGGGVIGYLMIFLWDADTDLKKTVAIVMLFICIIGEMATAGFGLQVNAWEKQGYTLTNSDFDSMVLVVQLLGFAHAIALVAYIAGDQLIEAFSDEDGDGIPNAFDRDYKGKKKQHQQQKQNNNGRRPELIKQYNSETDGKEDFTNPAPKQ